MKTVRVRDCEVKLTRLPGGAHFGNSALARLRQANNNKHDENRNVERGSSETTPHTKTTAFFKLVAEIGTTPKININCNITHINLFLLYRL